VGLAEASVAMAKLTKRQGDQAAAAAHINAAVGHYSEYPTRCAVNGSCTSAAGRETCMCTSTAAAANLTYVTHAGSMALMLWLNW
jgi:hypothetical protein